MSERKPSPFRPIRFRTEMMQSRMLQRDSSGAFVEVSVPQEIRFDPLTGRSCRLVHYSLNRITRPDLSALLEKSLKMKCPFCPPLVEEITPRFPAEIVPEGVIRKGKAVAFPNSGPYDTYGAVVVISDKHFIPLHEFTVETVSNALRAAYHYVKRVQEADSKAKYHFIAWNYLFPSGGSLMHPHMQCNVGYFPTNFQKQLLDASGKYYAEKGTNYWSDLIEQEKAAGQRYIGTTGNICWLTGFAPRGRLSDIMAIFKGKSSILELYEKDLDDFAAGLLKVFGFIDKLNVPSFNLSSYSGFDENQFWAHAVLTPRSQLLYTPIETSDQFYYQTLHDENICILSPELACRELQKHFSNPT